MRNQAKDYSRKCPGRRWPWLGHQFDTSIYEDDSGRHTLCFSCGGYKLLPPPKPLPNTGVRVA